MSAHEEADPFELAEREIADLRTQLDAVTKDRDEWHERAENARQAWSDSTCAYDTARADLLALQVEHGRVREALEWYAKPKHWANDAHSGYNDCDMDRGTRATKALSSPSPAADVGEAVRAIAEAIEDEWCHGKPDEKHARGDCTACNLASALRTLGLGPKE